MTRFTSRPGSITVSTLTPLMMASCSTSSGRRVAPDELGQVHAPWQLDDVDGRRRDLEVAPVCDPGKSSSGSGAYRWHSLAPGIETRVTHQLVDPPIERPIADQSFGAALSGLGVDGAERVDVPPSAGPALDALLAEEGLESRPRRVLVRQGQHHRCVAIRAQRPHRLALVDDLPLVREVDLEGELGMIVGVTDGVPLAGIVGEDDSGEAVEIRLAADRALLQLG